MNKKLVSMGIFALFVAMSMQGSNAYRMACINVGPDAVSVCGGQFWSQLASPVFGLSRNVYTTQDPVTGDYYKCYIKATAGALPALPKEGPPSKVNGLSSWPTLALLQAAFPTGTLTTSILPCDENAVSDAGNCLRGCDTTCCTNPALCRIVKSTNTPAPYWADCQAKLAATKAPIAAPTTKQPNAAAKCASGSDGSICGCPNPDGTCSKSSRKPAGTCAYDSCYSVGKRTKQKLSGTCVDANYACNNVCAYGVCPNNPNVCLPKAGSACPSK